MGRLGLEDAKALEDHLADCPACRQQLDEARVFVPAMQLALAEQIASESSAGKQDRRVEPRFPCDRIITLKLLEPPFEVFSGSLRDISRSGAGVRTKRAVMAETPVSITWSDASLIGRVRHCEKSTGRFDVGVSLDQGSPWWPVDLLYEALVGAGLATAG